MIRILRGSSSGTALVLGLGPAVSISIPSTQELMDSLTSSVGYNLAWSWNGYTPRFINRAKQGEWQGSVDAAGNLVDNASSVRNFVILVDDTSVTPNNIDYRGGHFTLDFDGGAGVTVAATGGASNLTGSGNSYEFDMTGTYSALQFSNISYADPPTNLRIVEDVNAAAFASGKIFEPKMLENNQHAGVFRFMQWAQTNEGTAGNVGVGSEFEDWVDYPSMDYQRWTIVPYLAQIEMCNEAHVNGWFCVPHRATDAFITTLADLIRDNLDPELTAYIEYSNECWNWGYVQPTWLGTQANAAWGGGVTLANAMNWYGKRVVEIVDLFETSFGGPSSRIKPMLATQNWDEPTRQMMYAPVWEANDPGNFVAPHTKVDTIAMAGYIPGNVDFFAGASGGTAIWNALQTSQAAAKALMIEGLDAQMGPYSFTQFFSVMELALAEGLQPVVYEGSDHLDLQQAFVNHPGNPLTNGSNAASTGVQALFEAVTYSDEIVPYHQEVKDLLRYVGAGVFCEFDDIEPTTEYAGTWGAQRTREDTNPIDTALRAYATNPERQLPFTAPDAGHPINENVQMLGVGHSLTDVSADMMDYFMTDHLGGSGAYNYQTIAGSGLQYNWDNAASVPITDGRALLAQGTQRAIMCTESVPNIHVKGGGWNPSTSTFDSPMASPTVPAREGSDVRAWVDWHNLAAANGVTNFYVYEPWQDIRTGTANQGELLVEDPSDPDTAVEWRDRIALDAPRNAQYVTLLQTGNHPALAYTATITPGTTIEMVPAAHVMMALRDALDNGLKPDAVTYTDFVTDMMLDTIHPALPARYAIACAMYSVMFKRCCVGMPNTVDDVHGNNYMTLGNYDKWWLQAIAWRAVKNHPLTGL